MRCLNRIIYKVLIIFSVFTVIGIGCSDRNRMPTVEQINSMHNDMKPPEYYDSLYPRAKTIPKEDAIKLIEAMKEADPNFNEKILVLGWDSKNRKLESLAIPANELKFQYDLKEMNYASQALFTNSLIAYTNSLEDRVRKLENTVNRIIANCCPESKGI